jgi:hypothetical protein
VGGGLYLAYLTTMDTLPSIMGTSMKASPPREFLEDLLQLSEALADASAVVTLHAETQPHPASFVGGSSGAKGVA